MTEAHTRPLQGPLQGTTLALVTLSLALGNFMEVLDTTIANVSVGHIAGSLGISTSQGTWIITSYAVAEAICKRNSPDQVRFMLADFRSGRADKPVARPR